MELNTKEYWQKRFIDGDWEKMGGEEQSSFFAQLFLENMPDWLEKDLEQNKWEVADYGCAEGAGTALIARKFPRCHFTGYDFSSAAISTAQKKYPTCNFCEGNMAEQIVQCDVIFSSNTLEHFTSPGDILEKLINASTKHTVIMIPFEDDLDIEEHMHSFNAYFFKDDVENHFMSYFSVIDCRDRNSPYWPGKQAVLVYTNSIFRRPTEYRMADMYQASIAGLIDDVHRLTRDSLNLHQNISQFVNSSETLSKEKDGLQERIEQLTSSENALLVEKNQLQAKITLLEASEKTLLEEKNDLQERVIQLTNAEKALTEENNDQSEKIALLMNSQIKSADEVQRLNAKIEKSIRDLDSLHEFVNGLIGFKAVKLVHLINRIVQQLLRGDRRERREFWKWLSRHLHHEKNADQRYNPMCWVLDRVTAVQMELLNGQLNKRHECGLPEITQRILTKKYEKPDVIIFSVINYDFRFQRPQHFAKRFASDGHRVFYINAIFTNPECVREICKNLYTVDFMTTETNAIYFIDQCSGFQGWIREKMENLVDTYGIRDAILVLDYPNWIDVSEYLRKRYGFHMAADYMDDATGFLNTTTDSLKENCERMLSHCDVVIPSSQFLSDIARKYTENIAIVRNGTEIGHFEKAMELERHCARPVVGYYGAISHWFDWEKICFLAENLPQCDIVLIGEVSEYEAELKKYDNIRLLGEMAYQNLPEHLAYFDVCLIPFDTSTDLIKATNPVKFYEYLSAGKRIVATEIPELEPYRDRYVYMSNDNQEFLKYVQLCLNGKDSLAPREECVDFAKQNDWKHRYESFKEACVSAAPKVSVIVLTYNNLRLNQYCIESILENTAYPNYELIVLDNQSTDGTVDYLRELEEEGNPRVKVVLNSENSGFAGGNNKAIRMSNGKYVVLLNNDTVVTRGWLTALVKHMEADPQCGMVGAVTNSIGNEQMVAVNYTNLMEMSIFAYSYTQMHMAETYRKVDRIPLFCTIIRKSVLDQHGMLDDGYRVGMFEDDDFALLVKEAGYTFCVAEDCFVHHVNNASFKKLHPEEYQKIFDENRSRYEKKWNTTWTAPHYRDGVTWDTNRGTMVEPIE